MKYRIKYTNRGLTTNCLPYFIEFWQDGIAAYAGKNGYVFKNPIGFKSEGEAKKWIKKNFDPTNLIIKTELA